MHACRQRHRHRHRHRHTDFHPPTENTFKKKKPAGGAEEEGHEKGWFEVMLGDATDGEKSFATGVFQIFSLRE